MSASAVLPPAPAGYSTWPEYCHSKPDDQFCNQNVRSYYMYRPSEAANAVFIALFVLSGLAFLATWVVTRRARAFTVAFLLGVICEILGYMGRLMSSRNRWDGDPFMIQICCLTIGPAFMAAGIYLCLRRIVGVFGPENSRIRPQTYTRFFIPCDLLSLVLQAIGGAMASIASQNDDQAGVDRGDHIMMAGLSFQVFTLIIFMSVSIDLGLNVRRRAKQFGDAALDQSELAHGVRNSRMFKGMLVALCLSTVSIFWRSSYRVAELSRGWTGPLMKRQDLFIGFEGVLIVLACSALNLFHPAVCFRGTSPASDSGRIQKDEMAAAAGTPSLEMESGYETCSS